MISFRRCIAILCGLALFGLCAIGGAHAQTTAPVGPLFMSIDDFFLGESIGVTLNAGGGYTNPTAPGYNGSLPLASNVVVQITQESPTDLGAVDWHVEYQSSATFPIPGDTLNFNFFNSRDPHDPLPGSGFAGDTLSISFAPHTPINANDNANVSVDGHFRSDNNVTNPTALQNAINIDESAGWVDFTRFFDPAFGGQSDFNLRIVSDVPEPGSLALLGGVLVPGAVFWIRRRRG